MNVPLDTRNRLSGLVQNVEMVPAELATAVFVVLVAVVVEAVVEPAYCTMTWAKTPFIVNAHANMTKTVGRNRCAKICVVVKRMVI